MRFRGVVVLVFLLLFAGMASAACGAAFTASDSFLSLENESQAIVSYDSEAEVQHLVVRPMYMGAAEDFGVVYPLPSQPDVSGTDNEFFEQIHDLSSPTDFNPFMTFPLMMLGGSTIGSSGVDVISQEGIGDFEVTVLEATSVDALESWLTGNNYTLDDHVRENLPHYVEGDDSYFVALRVKPEQATCLARDEYQRIENATGMERQNLLRQQQFSGERTTGETASNDSSPCYLAGSLSPVEMAFTTEQPFIPFYILRNTEDHSEKKSFLMYTYADQPLLVSGAEAQYINEIEHVEPPLDRFGTRGFLTRQRVTVDTADIEDDLYFQPAKPVYVAPDSAAAIPGNADGTGVIPASGAPLSVTYSDTVTQLDRLQFTVSRGFQESISILQGSILTFLILLLSLPFILFGILLVVPLALVVRPLAVVIPVASGTILGALFTQRNALRTVPVLAAVTATGVMLLQHTDTIMTGTLSHAVYHVVSAGMSGIAAGAYASVIIFLFSTVMAHSTHVQTLRDRITDSQLPGSTFITKDTDHGPYWKQAVILILVGTMALSIHLNMLL